MSIKKSSAIILLALIAVAAIPLAVPEFIRFGSGTEGSSQPGSNPFSPALYGYGDPAPGAEVNLYLTNCFGDQPGFLIMGTRRQNTPFFDGVLYPSLGTVQSIWVTALGGFPPVGYWSRTGLAIPDDPDLIGRSLYMQAITQDPGNPYGATLSNGLEMLIL
jgi:hypothetical protein